MGHLLDVLTETRDLAAARKNDVIVRLLDMAILEAARELRTVRDVKRQTRKAA